MGGATRFRSKTFRRRAEGWNAFVPLVGTCVGGTERSTATLSIKRAPLTSDLGAAHSACPRDVVLPFDQTWRSRRGRSPILEGDR